MTNYIPVLTPERIQELAKQVKPVVRFPREPDREFLASERDLYYIEPVDLFGVAYTWEPKPTDKALGLKPICDIRTYHAYGYYGFFKPSIAEVLAQIPAEHLDSAVAFEIVNPPKTTDDLSREREALNAGYHVATTRLYAQDTIANN